MRSVPRLQNGFILNDSEYQLCKAWLQEATEQIVRRPLEDADLEMQRREMKSLVDEYEANWQTRSKQRR
jgi:hypothetical protein